MGKRIDLTGQRFGRLVVISLNEEVSKQKKNGVYWNCKCDCGKEKVIRGGDLRSGGTTSCGCYQKEKVSEIIKKQWEDEEFRQMQSNKRKRMNEEMWKDNNFRQKQSNATKEKWKNEDFKQMMSNRAKKQWKDDEFRQMHSDMSKKMWQNEDFKQMKIDRVKKQWENDDFRQMQSNKAKKMWHDKNFRQRMTGESNPSWKGGITSIKGHLRKINEQWYNDCKQQANYTCELTGRVGGKLHTHHLKAFSTIVLEAHELNNIEIHEIIGEYGEEELHIIEKYVVSWHKDNSNAVVLCEEAHTLFHSLYGKGNNTPEQYEEFKQRYINGEFKEIIK